MKITRLLLVALIAGLFSLAGCNTTDTTPKAAAQPPPPPPPMTAEQRRALAREVITAAQADKMFDGVFAQMKQLAASSAPIPASATPEQRQKFEEFQGKVMDVAKESARGLLDEMDKIYADVYSEKELQAMKAFFNSPEGQSMVAKQPQIMTHVMPMVQQMQRDMRPKIQVIVDQMKADMKAARAAKAAEAAAAKSPEMPVSPPAPKQP